MFNFRDVIIYLIKQRQMLFDLLNKRQYSNINYRYITILDVLPSDFYFNSDKPLKPTWILYLVQFAYNYVHLKIIDNILKEESNP